MGGNFQCRSNSEAEMNQLLYASILIMLYVLKICFFFISVHLGFIHGELKKYYSLNFHYLF